MIATIAACIADAKEDCDRGEFLTKIKKLISECHQINHVTYAVDSKGKRGIFAERKAGKLVYSIATGGSPATLSHFAAVNGQADVLQALLENNHFPNKVILDNLQNTVTASQIAYENKHDEFLNVLHDRNEVVTCRACTAPCDAHCTIV